MNLAPIYLNIANSGYNVEGLNSTGKEGPTLKKYIVADIWKGQFDQNPPTKKRNGGVPVGHIKGWGLSKPFLSTKTRLVSALHPKHLPGESSLSNPGLLLGDVCSQTLAESAPKKENKVRFRLN